MVDHAQLIRHLSSVAPESFGVLSQQASPTAEILHDAFGTRMASLFSPEHGWFGLAAAGEKTFSTVHPYWNIPVHSLYGESRKPKPEMLQGIGRVVVDLQDIGVRCYTYLATLKLMLEAAAERKLAVTVLDRPIPLGGVLDGPRRAPQFSSFVAPLDIPLCHGMTPGECATFIVREQNLDVDLTVIRMADWSHLDRAPWPNFVPPSPAIRSWDCAALYPATVFTEAAPAVDCDRGGSLAFRVIGAPWLDAAKIRAEVASDLAACGLSARPIRYQAVTGPYQGQVLNGLLLSLEDPAVYRPVTVGAILYGALYRNHPDDISVNDRPEWFEKLFGYSAARESFREGDLQTLFAEWRKGEEEFLATRIDLYRRS